MSDQWYYSVNGQNYGPYTKVALGQMVAGGQINRQTMVNREGMPGWEPMEKVPELRDICAGGSNLAAPAGGSQTMRTQAELNNPDLNYYLAYKIDFSETDEAKIQHAMAMTKNSFMQGTAVRRRLLELYEEATRIMADPVLRQEELQAAQRLKPINDRIKDIGRDPRFMAYTGRIEPNLRLIGKNDLYDWLGLPPSASVTSLQDAIQTMYNSVRESGKMDSQSTAIRDLSGHAKMTFKDETSKQNYDAYLAAKG